MQYISVASLFVGAIALTAQLSFWAPGLRWILGFISFALLIGGSVPFTEEHFSHYRPQVIIALTLWTLALMLGYQFPWGWE